MADRSDAAGTNPIHNKKPKKAEKGEEDEEDKAYKAKQVAGEHEHALCDENMF